VVQVFSRQSLDLLYFAPEAAVGRVTRLKETAAAEVVAQGESMEPPTPAVAAARVSEAAATAAPVSSSCPSLRPTRRPSRSA
jgi:hypothetical protein